MNSNIQNVVNMFKFAKNPNLLLQHLSKQNPMLANIMNLVSQNGGDPKKTFYEEARKRGVDPNQVLNMLNRNL